METVRKHAAAQNVRTLAVDSGRALIIGAGWRLAPDVLRLLQDPELLEEAIERIGWFGPLALVGLNALQIVVAPIPGYVVLIAAGFLYGPVMGSLWGALGLLLGATIAFGWRGNMAALWRRSWRKSWLDRWEPSPTAPARPFGSFFCSARLGIFLLLAGLSRVGFLAIIVITAILRIPSIIVAASAGAGVMLFSVWQLVAIVAGLAGIVVVFLRYQRPIMFWFEGRVRRELKEELGQDTQ